MEIQQFRYFLAAARYENLTKAAEDLHIAQPALSQSIKRLETELGVSLFDRKNHRIELNEQGKLLKKRLIPILESIDNLKDELWESVYSSERTIYLNFLSASNLITNSIISYRALKPDVQFQVSQLEMTESCDRIKDRYICDASASAGTSRWRGKTGISEGGDFSGSTAGFKVCET